MAFFEAQNIALQGIVSCVPNNRIDNLNDENISKEQAEKILSTTGIRFRRIAPDNVTTSDLCAHAAEELIGELSIEKGEIEILIFVTQTPDYILPASASLLQHRLNLKETTLAFDINMGCSGYVYGLSVVSSLLANSKNPDAKALLLVGDTISKIANPKDLSTYPLFGDAGSATLLSKSDQDKMVFDLFTDGKGGSAIEVTHGGFRNPYSEHAEQEITRDGVNFHKKKDLYLNGMDVFSFGITRIPKAVRSFLDKMEITDENIDFYVFHQANKFMNEKIRKKIDAGESKVPYTLYEYGNVSSATIPLTICDKLSKLEVPKSVLCCGFGVGLSWGISYFNLRSEVLLKTIELN